MTNVSSLTSIDPRSPWQKVSRRQCYRGAKRLEIPYKDNATKDEMVTIFQSNNLTPEQIVNFVPVQVPTPDGGQKIVMYPEERERKENEAKDERRMAEFQRRIEEGVEKDKAEKANEVQSLKAEIHELKDMFSQVLESLKKPEKKKVEKEETLENMQWKKFQKLAKSVGVDWTTRAPRDDVIAILRAQDNVKEAD